MTDNIGERIASLEAEFKSFRHEILKDNVYIRGKLDSIAEAMPQKVDRPYCQDRHEKLGDRVGELEKDGRYDKLVKRIRDLEGKAPALIQSIVIGLTVGTIMATISYTLSRLP